jgi:signal transduction histidine kinase
MLSRPVAGTRGVSVVDLGIAAALSVFAVLLVSGVTGSSHHGGTGTSIGVLAMTVPVAWRRRAPIAAAATIAIGAGLNALIWGHLVRCGPCLPAAFFIAFEIGVRTKGRWSLAGFALVAANIVVQTFFDPQLAPVVPDVFGFVGVAAVFYAVGRLVASRTALASELRRQNAELREQREQTARLAVMADRSEVAGNLDDVLRSRIADIAITAAAGRQSVTTHPERAKEALVSVEREGRAVLQEMRAVVGSLHDDAPSEPQPALAQLSRLLDRATTADTRLTIEGTPRSLPSGVELSGYRIVEHLLMALDDTPDAGVEVRLFFGPDVLEVKVAGPTALRTDLAAIVAAAKERAALHGGTVHVDHRAGTWSAIARLPLISGYA